ncbi:hypothetical protein SCLCIDRAFT_459901 [Scleroderma citrinum Foug A]|uniref:Uncharacterized protein n=1 Tax=Scleroderma citrinum Foug A TaxID=1036808 RepID=A0A0C2ZKG1_9AGAM|nr:hypothetical protein SCLCIDRAFT_459901 [Scleroderma citrinum Foug A]
MTSVITWALAVPSTVKISPPSLSDPSRTGSSRSASIVTLPEPTSIRPNATESNFVASLPRQRAGWNLLSRTPGNVAFYNVHRCWLQDAPSVAEDRPSALTFSMYFVVPPFFSCSSGSNVRYQPEMNWKFPLFIRRRDNTNALCRFYPRSDFGVAHPEYLCPLVVSETFYEENESDRWRMLIEAIAAARAGHFLMKSDAEERFFVVAIYLRRSLEAERYIVMQTSADEGNPVLIVKKTFNLTMAGQSTDFFLEVFNLTTMLSQIMQNLDAAKKSALQSIKDDAKGLRSVSSATHPRWTSTNRTNPASIPEDDEAEAEDGLGVFEADDIQEKVQAMGFEVTFRVFGVRALTYRYNT